MKPNERLPALIILGLLLIPHSWTEKYDSLVMIVLLVAAAAGGIYPGLDEK